jgi:putative transposase
MSRRFQISRDSQALYITINTKDRLAVFRKEELKNVLCSAIDEARRSAGLLLFAYVIMIDHLHVITDQPKPISEILRLLKGITARRVIDYLKENNYLRSLAKLQHQARDRNYRYSLWQTEKNVFPIFSEGLFMEKVNYIHNNPVRAGYVDRAIDYRWSSARIWQGCPLEDEPLLVDIDKINWRRSR